MEGDILVLQLRQHGLPLDASLTPADFTTDLLFSTLIQGLVLSEILSEKESRKRFPQKVPSATAARFGVAGSLLSYMTSAGHPDVPLDVLVYPSEATTRPILAWLVSELGRAADAAEQQLRAADAEQDQVEGQAASRAVQNGLLALAKVLAVAEDTALSKGAKKAGGRALLMAPRRRTTRRQQSSSSPLSTFYAISSTPWAEDVTALDQIEHTWQSTGARIPHCADDKPLSMPEILVASLSEACSAESIETKEFQKMLAHRLGDGSLFQAARDKADAARYRTQSKATSAAAILAQQTPATGPQAFRDALYSTADDAMLARRDAEAADEMERAVASMEEKRQSALERDAKRAAEADNVREQLTLVKRVVREKKATVNSLEGEIDALQKQLLALQSEHGALEEEAANRVKDAEERQALLALMDNPTSSEEVIEARMAEIQEKRKAYRDELQQKFEKVEAKMEELAQETAEVGGDYEEQLNALRQEIKKTKQLIKSKRRETKRFEAEYAKAPKDIDRNSFLRLIFDMTANIRKQGQQLDKVRGEIAHLNKSIEGRKQAVTKLFAGVEDRVYATAKNDEFARQAFKLVVEVREAYAGLVAAMERLGTAKQELHELEEKIDKIRRLVERYNVAKLQSDLAEIETDNAGLEDRLAELQEGGK